MSRRWGEIVEEMGRDRRGDGVRSSRRWGEISRGFCGGCEEVAARWEGEIAGRSDGAGWEMEWEIA